MANVNGQLLSDFDGTDYMAVILPVLQKWKHLIPAEQLSAMESVTTVFESAPPKLLTCSILSDDNVQVCLGRTAVVADDLSSQRDWLLNGARHRLHDFLSILQSGQKRRICRIFITTLTPRHSL
jgi:hypothetical protein